MWGGERKTNLDSAAGFGIFDEPRRCSRGGAESDLQHVIDEHQRLVRVLHYIVEGASQRRRCGPTICVDDRSNDDPVHLGAKRERAAVEGFERI